MRTQKKNDSLVVLTVAVGTFMAALDSSVVNIAMPVLQSEFHASLAVVEWVVTAYLLVVSSLLLTFGRMSDLYGKKALYLAGMTVFTLGSLACGLAGSVGMLIAFRVVQALGAGMMLSCGTAIITDTVSPEKRGRALSINAVAVAVALCTGPVLGGVLLSALGWSSIFLINVPVGAAAMYLVIRNIPADRKKAAAPFDPLGSVLIFAALMLILFPLDASAGETKLAPVATYALLGAGALAAVAFVLHEKRFKYPILDMSLFKNRVFAASNAAAAFNYMAQYIMIFLVPFYLQKLRLFSPAVAGLLYIPMPLVTLTVAPFSGVLADRFDSRLFSSAGMGIVAIGMFLLSRLSPTTSNAYIIISMAVTGIGVGLFQTPNNSAIMGSVPPEHRGIASGALATMRNIGMVLGVATSGMLFSLFSGEANAQLAASLSGTQLQQAVFTSALHMTFVIAALIALVAMVASLIKGEVRPGEQQRLTPVKSEGN